MPALYFQYAVTVSNGEQQHETELTVNGQMSAEYKAQKEAVAKYGGKIDDWKRTHISLAGTGVATVGDDCGSRSIENEPTQPRNVTSET